MNAKSALALKNEQSPEVILDEEEAIRKEKVTFLNMHLPKSSRIQTKTHKNQVQETNEAEN